MQENEGPESPGVFMLHVCVCECVLLSHAYHTLKLGVETIYARRGGKSSTGSFALSAAFLSAARRRRATLRLATSL